MSKTLKCILFSASITMIAMLAAANTAPGTQISDETAAELRGGCAGAVGATCTQTDICSINGYLNPDPPNDNGYDPNNVHTTYCAKRETTPEGTFIICNDSMAGIVSCGT